MRYKIKSIAAAFVATIVFSGLFASCSGRTKENMEPVGDTVEVNVCSPADAGAQPEQADSATCHA